MTTQSTPIDPPQSPTPSWTPEKQSKFLEALARCGSVKAAAAFVGMSREGAYRLRRRDAGRAFARAWDAALIHARDLFADTLLDTGLNGWTETVWYHGEEVGERSRFSPSLLLAALTRLDDKADGLNVAGNAAREAAADFDAMVEAIGEGEDCAAMLDQQDQRAAARLSSSQSAGLAGMDDGELAEMFARRQEYQRIEATAPEDIDISDLDPDEADYWDDLQWARAERSGMTAEPGFWEKVALDTEYEDNFDDDYEDGDDDPDDDQDNDGDPDEPEADVRRFG